MLLHARTRCVTLSGRSGLGGGDHGDCRRRRQALHGRQPCLEELAMSLQLLLQPGLEEFALALQLLLGRPKMNLQLLGLSH